MGVSISVAGAVRSPEIRKELLRWIDAQVSDLEWSRRPVDLRFKKARLRSGARMTWLELPHAFGVSLLPHFASEELPIVFLEADGMMVDEIVEDAVMDTPTFLPGVIVKTQFAGPRVHREVCDVLREIKTRFASAITIDDETGFMASGDQRALDRAFDEGWAEIRAKVEADRPRPGTRFQVGEFPFEVPVAEVAREFAGLNEKQRASIVSWEAAFGARFGGFGFTLDRSRASVIDLELAISDVDAPDFRKDPESPEIQDLVLQAGAYFGRTILSALGGAWRIEDDQLVLFDVGRSGLLVDPFQVARDRILRGPPFGFTHHLEVFENLATHLGRSGAG